MDIQSFLSNVAVLNTSAKASFLAGQISLNQAISASVGASNSHEVNRAIRSLAKRSALAANSEKLNIAQLEQELSRMPKDILSDVLSGMKSLSQARLEQNQLSGGSSRVVQIIPSRQGIRVRQREIRMVAQQKRMISY